MGAIVSVALLSFASVFQVERRGMVPFPRRIRRYRTTFKLLKDNTSASILSDQERKAKNRLYCMVPITYTPKKQKHMQAIAQTWGKRCDLIKFFVEPPRPGETIPPSFIDNVTGFEIPFVVVPMVRVNDQISKSKSLLISTGGFGSSIGLYL